VRDTDGSFQSRFVDCSACGAKRLSGEACVHCGYYPTRAAEAIAFQDGDLSLYDRRTGTTRQASEPQEQLRWHAQLACIAAQRGYKRGWAAHKYRERFGDWPPVRTIQPMQPSLEVLSWVRNRTIAWAKMRQKATAA
jgi:hypothetical protein